MRATLTPREVGVLVRFRANVRNGKWAVSERHYHTFLEYVDCLLADYDAAKQRELRAKLGQDDVGRLTIPTCSRCGDTGQVRPEWVCADPIA